MPLLIKPAKGRWRPEALFRPQNVAVVSAAGPLGSVVMQNLLEAGFHGPILPLAPGVRSVSGVLTYPDVASLPMVPDLAVLDAGMDTRAVATALMERGTRVAICLAGASEADAARAAGLRVLGPCSFGVCVPALGLAACTAHVRPMPGRLALVAQSASMCRAVLDWAEPNGVGFSHVVGIGRGGDLDFAPVLDWLSRDPGTGAILLELRTVRDRRAFLSAARAAASMRPVVAIHAGGRMADPTGQSDRIFDAAMRRAGVIRVNRFADLLATAEILTLAKPARNERLAIVTNAVGPGQIAADAALAAGLRLLDEPPADASADAEAPQEQAGMTVAGTPGTASLAQAATDAGARPDVGGVLAVLVPSVSAGKVADALAQAAPRMKVPLLVCAMGEATGAGHRHMLADAGVPAFASPELAVRGFEHLVLNRRARAAARELPSSTVLAIAPERARVQRLLGQVRAAGRTSLLQDEALAVLAAYGIPTVPTLVALTEEDAVAVAARLGFPSVLKLRRSTQPSIGAPGGVALDLRSDDAVRQAARALSARRAGFAAHLLADGFLVQRQAVRSRELRVRVQDDPYFGPAIGFGAGGSAGELLEDLAWDLPPLNLTLADALIARTRIARALGELHDQAAAKVEAVSDALVRISQLLVDFPEIAGLDANPIFANPAGVSVADAWIGLRGADAGAVLAIAPYPAELTESWTSRGEEFLIRPIRPEDAQAHAALFARLSPEDVRFRFFTVLRTLPPEQIARLTQVDYDREIAFVAVRRSTDETVGAVRLVREPNSPEAEFAILIESSVKGRGLGRLMMQKIIGWGRAKGVAEIVGQVLLDNRPMLAFIRRIGFAIRPMPDEPDVVEARLVLDRGTPDAAS